MIREAWEGTEVEGRFVGAWTLFVSGQCVGIDLTGYTHLWVTQDHWSRFGFELARRALNFRMNVSVELFPPWPDLPPDIRAHCELVYTLDLTGYQLPQDKDCIRVIERSYQVRTVSYGAMRRADPVDYSKDKKVR